jgi:hypothetical protein
MAAIPRSRRRFIASLGLVVPGLACVVITVYVFFGASSDCVGACAGNASGVAAASFPAAIVCLVLAAAVLRGQRWSRWPAVIAGAVLATVSAAGTLAGVMALGSAGNDPTGATVVGICGAALAAVCALPAVLLPGERGEATFPPPKEA